MVILVVHSRYFLSAGPERYLFNVMELLEREGNTVIPFSVAHSRNRASPYAKYFLQALGDGDERFFDEIAKTPRNVAKLIGRNFYSWEAIRKLGRLLTDHPVDVAYVLGYWRWISPSILHVLAARRIPIVVRLSDYHMLCSKSTFLRQGKPCELCKQGAWRHALRYRCVQGSLPVTLADVSARWLHGTLGSFDLIHRFVAPSRFLFQKMIEGGYSENRLALLPTFIDTSGIRPNYCPGDYLLYFGRIAPEKGLDVLLSAWAKVLARRNGEPRLALRIIGESNRGERERLEVRVRRERLPAVSFQAPVAEGELQEVIAGAFCTVMPSLWYENVPNAVLESYAFGKPVIASAIGSLPEVVKDERTGLLARPGDAADLSRQLSRVLANPRWVAELGRTARRYVETECLPESHYERLLAVLQRAVADTRT
ncbi:MAG: glycosyltransferase family 4 protein [bacterium]